MNDLVIVPLSAHEVSTTRPVTETDHLLSRDRAHIRKQRWYFIEEGRGAGAGHEIRDASTKALLSSVYAPVGSN